MLNIVCVVARWKGDSGLLWVEGTVSSINGNFTFTADLFERALVDFTAAGEKYLVFQLMSLCVREVFISRRSQLVFSLCDLLSL